MVTDKLKSYGAAKQEITLGVEHRQHKGLNNRAENSHQPTRQRERQMKRFKSPRHAQQVLSAHDQINNLFYLRRHRLTAVHYRAACDQAFATCRRSPGLHGQRDWNVNSRPVSHPLLPGSNNLTMLLERYERPFLESAFWKPGLASRLLIICKGASLNTS